MRIRFSAVSIWCFLLMQIPMFVLAQDTLGKKNSAFVYEKNGRYRSNDGFTKLNGRVRDHYPYGEWTVHQKAYSEKGKPFWYKRAILNYANGEMNGRYIVFSEKGDTIVTGHYAHSKMVGVWTYYYTNPYQLTDATVSARREYDAQGNNTGLWISYYANGETCEIRKYTDPSHCYKELHSANGIILEQGEYNKELPSGNWKYYREETDSAGKRIPVLYRQCEWKSGEKDGAELFYQNGKTVSEFHYTKGIYNGISRKYEDGKLIHEINYTDGVQDGEQKYYAPSGAVKLRLICSKGIPLVRHECDSATGVVVKSIWYSPGQIDSLKEWNRSGTLTYSRKLVADTHHLWIAQNYYDSGVLRDSGLFDGITWSGKNYHWYESGKLNYIDTRNGYGSCIAYDVWTEKGVHVLHCLPSRGRDTVPEIVLSDNGRKLTYGTKEFEDQRNKYFPAHLEPYDEFTFYFPTIVVAKKYYMETGYDRPGQKYEERKMGGQAVYMELADSTATNRRDAPDFPGGNAGLSHYFRNNIQYPTMASEAGLQGTVWLQFVVDEKGQVNDCQILRGVTLVIDKEAERVVRYMPPWTPATKKGKAVKSRCVIGVKFVLVEG